MLIALAGALVAMVFTASAAQAAPSWHDGVVDYSYSVNCSSMIFGTPYLEATAGSYAGVYVDDANLPDAGEVFYVRMTVAGLGAPCAGPYAHMELALPTDVNLAISQDFPVFCYGQRPNGNQWVRETAACRQTPGQGAHGYTFGSPDGAPYPLPQGAFWQIQVPVYSTKPLSGIAGTRVSGCGDCFFTPIQILDGGSSPFQFARQYLNVSAAQPAAGFPNPLATFSTTQATTTSYEFNYFIPGEIAVILTEDANHNGNPLDDATFFVTPVQTATANDYAVEVKHTWSGLKPNADYLYELGFKPTGAADYLVASPRSFHTPGTFTGGTVTKTGSATGTATPPPPEKTAPPAAQPAAVNDAAITKGLDALHGGANARQDLPRPPLFAMTPVLKVKPKALLKKGVTIATECKRACTIKLELLLSAKDAKRYKLGKKKPVVIATASKALTAPGKASLTLKLTKAARKRLAKAKKLKLTLRSTATEAGAAPLVTATPLAVG
jgi:hypothetical protein